jgi:glutathione S-transferase
VARREALQRVALATGIVDKAMALAYERLIRPADKRWPDWIERCRLQVESGLAALAARPWPDEGRLDQAWITTACMVRYLRLSGPDLLPEGRHPSLDAVSRRCERLPAFEACWPADYAVPASR